MKILVAYASKHGATKGIAERIASTIAEDGHEVDLKDVRDAGELGAYDAFVIGSAAYMGGWLGEATTFVRRNASLLAERPVWLFSSGPVGPDKVDKEGRDVLVASEPKEFTEFEAAIHPRDKRVFFGAYDPSVPAVGIAEGFMERFVRLFPAVKDVPPAGDFRDWPVIEAWAQVMAKELQRVPATV